MITCLKKYPTLDGQLSFLKSLLYKFGRYLTQLDLTAYGHCNIVPVVDEYCPNLVELRLRFTYVDNVILFDAFSRLSKLKVLAIIFQDFDEDCIPFTLINSIKNLAGTLTNLTLLNWLKEGCEPCEFSKKTIDVFRQLKSLERVDISGIKPHDDLFAYLCNEVKFELHDIYLRLAETSKMKNIYGLILNETITDDGLYTIANNLKLLEVLYILWDTITNVGVVTISKMNLSVFSCTGTNTAIDSSSISLLKNLNAVGLSVCNEVTDDLAIMVLKNSPDLQTFATVKTSVTVEFIKKAAEISASRKKHLCLRISPMLDTKKYESPYLTIKHITL